MEKQQFIETIKQIQNENKSELKFDFKAFLEKNINGEDFLNGIAFSNEKTFAYIRS